jgi:hypothetical protein
MYPLWNVGWVVLFVILLTFMPTTTAYAYLDPGSGSLIVQVIIAGILGILVALKLYWTRITNFILRRKPEIETESNEAGGDETS